MSDYDLVSFYLELVGWTIFFNDYCLQIGREAHLLWTRKLTWATILYLIARYALFVSYATTIIANFGPNVPTPESRTNAVLMQFAESMDIMAQTAVAVVMILRTYAIYNRSFKVLALISILGSMVPALGFWISGTLTAGSHIEQADSPIPFRSMLLSLFTLIFDTVIIGLTIAKSSQERRTRTIPKQSMLNLILWDGSIYFCAMSSTHMFNILLYCFAPRGLCGIGIPPSRSLAVVLVCRFMLNLREQYYRPHGITPDDDGGFLSSLVFVPPSRRSESVEHSDEGFFHLPSLGFDGSFQFSFMAGDQAADFAMEDEKF